MFQRTPFIHHNSYESESVYILFISSADFIVISAINELPAYLDMVLHKIEPFTGFSASIMVGGAISAANGAILSTR
jgi:hypothetical protein